MFIDHMKRSLLTAALLLVFAAFAAAQEGDESSPMKRKATEAEKQAVFDEEGRIRRGAPLGDSKLVPLADVLESPEKYAGQTVRVEGYVVRSCKKEGCWAELGTEKDAKRTVRVKMKDHNFFIPLRSAGFKAVTEGVFSVKTLSKEEVEHLIEDDGAQFEKINEDGTVTEISFLASGIELTEGD